MTEPCQPTDDASRPSHAPPRLHTQDLTRFKHVAAGRELHMISKLQREVNELCQRHGETARYPLEIEQDTKAVKAESPSALSSEGLVPLEAILCTEELQQRPSRPPDYESENRALVALAQALADSPRTILQTLAEKIMDVLEADSAGVSLLSEDEQSFFWSAIAGAWQPHLGGGTPRNFGPCGDVLDCNAPQLFKHPERRYGYFLATTPPAEECLLVPFYLEGKAAGTIWAIAHDDRRKFDSEDLRQLESLGRFASAAYQAQILGAREQRHAALRLEDALQSGQAMEKLNAEFRESEAALRRSEGYLRDFVENAAIGLHWVGSDGIILWANQTELDLLGYSREEYIGHHIADFHADQPVIADILVRLTGGETLNSYEARLRCKDGSIRHVLISSNALFENGKFVHTRCFTRDISERKQAEEALQESRRFLRSSLDALSGHIAVLDESSTILEVNEAWRRFADENQFTGAGYGVGASYLQVCEQTFPQVSEAAAYARGINDVIAGRRTSFETEYPCHSPTEQRWFVMRVTRFQSPGPVRIVIVHDNITLRKRVEDALRESEEFNRSIIESSPDCIEVLDLDGNLLSMQAGQALLGIEDIRPFLNKSWIDFWEGEDRRAARAAVERAAAGGAGSFVGFFRTLRGEAKWWDVKISPIVDANDEPARLLAVSRDVTQRKRAEMNLALLASVSQDLAGMTSVEEMMRTVGAKLAVYLGLSLCAFVEVSEAADQVVIEHDWHREDVPGLVGVYRLADFVEAEFIRVARTGETIVVRDIAADPRMDPEKFAALKIASFVCVPLIRDGQWRFALCLYHSTAYDWREDEIELTRELTARIWTRLERLRSETELRASEERFRNLFNSMDEGYCIIEMIFDEHSKPVDWRYLEVNPSFEKLTGMQDPLGKRIRELVPNLEEYWFETYGKVALTGEAVRFFNEAIPLNRWFDFYAFRFGEAESRKVAVLFTNITDRIKAEEALRRSEERFRALFDWGPIAMYSCDSAGVIQEYNRGAVNLWKREPKPGDTDEQFRGSFKTYLPDGTFVPYAKTAMTRMLKNEAAAVHDMEVVIERLDGSRITLVVNVVPLKDSRGEVTGAITCFYDITERSLLERRLQEQAEALIDLDRRKDEFLAMLSHELRNPLAPISNAVHLLRLQKNVDPLQQQARNIIERQVGQLKHLIDDLLEVSRITTGRVQLRPERIAVSGIVERALETARPLLDQRRHELTTSLPPQLIWLHADAARLEQVVVNLLNNAAKYTDEGGHIWLSVQQEGDTAVLRVRDTGVGIAPELLPRIFDLFTQAERSLDRSQGGLGIGLCLVQRLVELHGGSVEAYSVLGQGSEFVVRLPVMLTSTPPSSSPSTETAQPPEKGCRVLIVDDNVDSARSLADLLKMSGHDVRLAHDGPPALQTAINYRPDVVLLDIGLPGLSGFEVARRIRQQPTLKNIVLVALTGYGQETDRQRSLEAGFDHHLVKPADFGEVQKILVSIATKAT